MTQIVLLRGINVGPNNRIGMPVLRDALTKAGFANVRTYLQSGNVIADGDPDALVAAIQAVIDVPCVTRTVAELDAVIAANPFPEQALENPKALQVTFRAAPVPPEVRDALSARALPSERVALNGREIYTWHPEGIARSDLGRAVVQGKTLATARNWNTVLALRDLGHA